MEVVTQEQEQTPTVEEMTVAFERLEERRRQLDAQLLENAAEDAKLVALTAGVLATEVPSKEHSAAAAKARVEEERALEALARGGAERRAIDARLEELRFRIGRINTGKVEARVNAAKDEIKARLVAKHDEFEAFVFDVLTLVSLSGGRPWPENTLTGLTKHAGLNVSAICNRAQARGNAIRNGQKEA